MGIEIERKFLLADASWRGQVSRSERLAQGYVNPAQAVRTGEQAVSVRVRIGNERAWLNLKSREQAGVRQEFEYAIPVVDAEALLALCVGGRIEKRRHHLDHAGHHWEIDEFLGDNAGLIVAEIELSRPDERFVHPPWLGREVTGQARYYNLSLAEHPYIRWDETT